LIGFSLHQSNQQKKTVKKTLIKIGIIGLLTTLLILPVLIPGLRIYLSERTGNSNTPSPALASIPYYAIDKNHIAIRSILESKYLFAVTLLGLIAGIIYNKTRLLSILTIFWSISLLAEGFLFLLNIPTITFTNITAVLSTIYLPFGLATGIIGNNIQKWSSKNNQNKINQSILFVILLAGYFVSFARADQIEESRIKMTPQDERAMSWIQRNIPDDAVFVVNTSIQSPNLLLGTDAGYWIPYYSGHETTSATYLSSFGENFNFLKERAEAVQPLYGSNPSTTEICKMDVDFLYSGFRNPNNSPDFNIPELSALPGVQVIYDQDDIQILSICE